MHQVPYDMHDADDDDDDSDLDVRISERIRAGARAAGEGAGEQYPEEEEDDESLARRRRRAGTGGSYITSSSARGVRRPPPLAEGDGCGSEEHGTGLEMKRPKRSFFRMPKGVELGRLSEPHLPVGRGVAEEWRMGVH